MPKKDPGKRLFLNRLLEWGYPCICCLGILFVYFFCCGFVLFFWIEAKWIGGRYINKKCAAPLTSGPENGSWFAFLKIKMQPLRYVSLLSWARKLGLWLVVAFIFSKILCLSSLRRYLSVTLSRRTGLEDVNNTVLYKSDFGNIFCSPHYEKLELSRNNYAVCQASGN